MFQTNKIVNSWLDGRLKIQSIDNSELKEVVGYYPKGALRFRHFLRKNAFEGRCCSFFEDGSIHSEANYKDGKLSGIFREYNPNNGTCGYEGYFKDNLQSGTHFSWDEAGRLYSEKFFCEGELEGVTKEFFPNGELKATAEYTQGKLDGKKQEWYLNGNLRTQEFYISGKLDGTNVRFQENGFKLMETNYRKGKRHGPHRVWSQSGKLVLLCNYNRNILSGTYTKYAENGPILLQEQYLGGRRHGLCFYTNAETNERKKKIYVNGVEMAEEIYGKFLRGELTAKNILAIGNAEVRRICLEELGYARFLSQVEHTVLDIDGEQELVRVDWRIHREPLYLVKVKCPSTGAFYTLRVPPSMQNVKQAVAWTFRLTPDEYSPDKET